MVIARRDEDEVRVLISGQSAYCKFALFLLVSLAAHPHPSDSLFSQDEDDWDDAPALVIPVDEDDD